MVVGISTLLGSVPNKCPPVQFQVNTVLELSNGEVGRGGEQGYFIWSLVILSVIWVYI